jgi:hypothetical protein
MQGSTGNCCATFSEVDLKLLDGHLHFPILDRDLAQRLLANRQLKMNQGSML